MEYKILNNGVEIPSIGIGPGVITSSMHSRLLRKLDVEFRKIRLSSIVSHAVRGGYRLFDCDPGYGTQRLIANGISSCRSSGVFIQSRVSDPVQRMFRDSIIEGEKALRKELESTLEQFRIQKLDLLSFHWPQAENFLKCWSVMERCYKEGLVRAIGVSNCHEHHLLNIMRQSKIIPVTNQIEVHPLFSQENLMSFCRKYGIQVQAYSPLARFDERLKRKSVLSLCTKYEKTLSQIILRWHIQRGVIPIVRSLNVKRQKENLGVFDFSLSEQDIACVSSIDIGARVRYDPDNCDQTL